MLPRTVGISRAAGAATPTCQLQCGTTDFENTPAAVVSRRRQRWYSTRKFSTRSLINSVGARSCNLHHCRRWPAGQPFTRRFHPVPDTPFRSSSVTPTGGRMGHRPFRGHRRARGPMNGAPSYYQPTQGRRVPHLAWAWSSEFSQSLQARVGGRSPSANIVRVFLFKPVPVRNRSAGRLPFVSRHVGANRSNPKFPNWSRPDPDPIPTR